jgi:hypothetical protein
MIIFIKKNSLVKDIQEQFSACFPFLKIEFLKQSLNEKIVFKKEYVIANDFFKRISSRKDEGEIHLSLKQTVAALESHFKEYFGVSIHVYRRSGNVWIETTLTNDWTLERQNKEGEQITSHFSKRT